MLQLRKLSLAAFVWITAAMTLVAGTPHFTCRCPDGRVKSFCFGFSPKNATCCCNGGCCAKGAPGAKSCCSTPTESAKSCCGHTGHGGVRPESKGTSAGTGCCIRTLATQEPRSLTPSAAKVVKDVAFGLPLGEDGMPARGSDAAAYRPQREYQRPPPTDLVISLQHFLI